MSNVYRDATAVVSVMGRRCRQRLKPRNRKQTKLLKEKFIDL